ncbi:DUF2339 domain-containing protein [Pseudoalteromonas denitrificans]|uniref:Predicted membrane protein n=1 Tax=Pseudoalteromonas denitrificans DSM 6059 TaxID=1123010 RepID=A0A1I1P5N4_9GAMM|nr:DUF2339 domain-containing protein [Pseudoalteromonas denitrificans]SFD04986.1 Predicted membrane protein [Pseudoalteromonas denitrificans DSM 6059]
MGIIAIFIFIIGIVMEEYFYGFTIAMFFYLFDSNHKLKHRVFLLEKNTHIPKQKAQLDKENSIDNPITNEPTAIPLTESFEGPTISKAFSAEEQYTNEHTQIIKEQNLTPPESTLHSDEKSIVTSNNHHLISRCLSKISETILSTIFGPITALLSSFIDIYQHYKKQGKAPAFFLTIAGIITLVMGFGYLLQYSFNEYLPPSGKVVCAYLICITLMIFAMKLHKKRPDMSEFSASLIGLSLILFYLSSYFLGPFYQLTSDLVTFILLSLITLIGYILAKQYETRIVAFISLLGGAIAPILISGTAEQTPLLYLSFLCLICIGALPLAFSIRWPLLSQMSLVLSIAMVEFILAQADLTPSFFILFLLHIFFYQLLINIYFQWYKFKSSHANCIIQLSTIVAFILLTLEQTTLNNTQYAYLLLLNACITGSLFLISKFKLKKMQVPHTQEINIISIILSGLFIGIALLMMISPNFLGLIWGVEGLLLLFLGLYFGYPSVRKEAFLLLFIAILISIINISTWLFNAIAPLPILFKLTFDSGYLNLLSLVCVSFTIGKILQRFSDVLTPLENLGKTVFYQLSYILFSLFFMLSLASILPEGFWLLIILPLFYLTYISHKKDWGNIEKIALLHWFILLIPIIASALYVGNFHFSMQTTVAKIARIEAFLSLWAIAYYYRKFFKLSPLFNLAQKLDTLFFLLLPIFFLPSVYRNIPEAITLALWVSALISIIIFYKLKRDILWTMAKILVFIAALTSLYACYLVKFNSWQGYGLSALLLGCILLFILLLSIKAFTTSPELSHSLKTVKHKIVSLFIPTCIYWGISLFILIYGMSNDLLYGLFSVLIYCILLLVLPSFRIELKKHFGYISYCIWILSLALILGLWGKINSINLLYMSPVYLPLLLGLFLFSYSNNPLCVLTRRLGVKQRISMLLSHAYLTSFYLSMTYYYTLDLTGPLTSIILVVHGTNLLFHTLKAKYQWLMPVSIGYFSVATAKIMLWDISDFTVLQKVIAFMFIGSILLIAAYQFQKLKTKNE